MFNIVSLDYNHIEIILQCKYYILYITIQYWNKNTKLINLVSCAPIFPLCLFLLLQSLSPWRIRNIFVEVQNICSILYIVIICILFSMTIYFCWHLYGSYIWVLHAISWLDSLTAYCILYYCTTNMFLLSQM